MGQEYKDKSVASPQTMMDRGTKVVFFFTQRPMNKICFISGNFLDQNVVTLLGAERVRGTSGAPPCWGGGDSEATGQHHTYP